MVVSGSSVAAAQTDTVASAIAHVLSYKCVLENVKDTDALADALCASAATSPADWYIIGFKQYTGGDFTAYQKALQSNAANVKSATDKQRVALTMLALGMHSSFIDEARNSAGQLGVMSDIYGLMLFPQNEQTIMIQLLDLQKEDGGWNLSGAVSDTDVTAMAVQALAPYYQTEPRVKSAVDKALPLLSKRQKTTGDCTGFGGAVNAESTAQVLCALIAMGLDPLTDSRFIKNGKTLLDGLLLYQNKDGGFSHTAGAASGDLTSAQAFYALVAFYRFENGQNFIFDFRPADRQTTAADLTSNTTLTRRTAPTTKTTSGNGRPAEQSTASQAQTTASQGMEQTGEIKTTVTQGQHESQTETASQMTQTDFSFVYILLAVAAGLIIAGGIFVVVKKKKSV